METYILKTPDFYGEGIRDYLIKNKINEKYGSNGKIIVELQKNVLVNFEPRGKNDVLIGGQGEDTGLIKLIEKAGGKVKKSK